MNKKLLAIAIGAAMAAPMLAQADVKVSGTLNMSLDYLDTFRDWTSTTSTAKVWNVSSNASNFRIVADEDLGSGFKGIGYIQEFVRLDNLGATNTGAANNFTNATSAGQTNRTLSTNNLIPGEAYAGLGSIGGSVLLGSVDTPTKKNGRQFDLFNNQIGDSRNLDINNNRWQNTVSYVSPTFFGVTISYVHATNLDNNGAGADTGWWATGVPTIAKGNAFGVTYKGGPVVVGASLEKLTPNSTNPAASNTGLDDEKWASLGASFSMAGARVMGFYQKHDNVGMLAQGAANYVDKKTYGIGAAYTFAKETVKLQYYKVKDDAFTASHSGEAKMVAVGYEHAFSKTFLTYVDYAKTTNSSGANNNQAYSEAGGGHGDNPYVFGGNNAMAGLSFGLIYNF